MRNLIHVLEEKCGKNSSSIFRNWKKLEENGGQSQRLQEPLKILAEVLQPGSYPSQFEVKELN